MSRLGTQEGSSQTESKYQYQRAYALSRDLKDQILDYSNSQLHQLQSSSALVYVYTFRPLPSVFDIPRANLRQRATETAKSIQNLASSGVVAAQAKVGTLSDTMVTELQKVQVRRICITIFFGSYLSVQVATAALPANLQASFKPVQEKMSGAISDLSGVIKSDLPVNEKVTKVRATVQDHVTPVLETAAARLQDAIRALTARTDDAKEGETSESPSIENGNNASH